MANMLARFSGLSGTGSPGLPQGAGSPARGGSGILSPARKDSGMAGGPVTSPRGKSLTGGVLARFSGLSEGGGGRGLHSSTFQLNLSRV